MNIRHGDIILPSRSEAIDTIAAFTELEAEEIQDTRALSEALSGVSAALSSVALNYGTMLNDTNIGLWTEIGNGDDRHKFTVTSQGISGLSGASIWRSAVTGGTAKYYDHVNVPTAKVLDEFAAIPLEELENGWSKPSWTDIYALRARTSDEDGGSREEYWPYHKPVSRTPEYPTTAREDAVGYAKILSNLSKTLLAIVG